MAKTREQKKEILKSLEEKINNSKSVVFAQYDALTVKENEEIRNELRKEGSEYFVSKKTFFDLAFKDQNIEGLDIKSFEGKVAAVFGYEDEVAPAKIIDKFKKKFENKLEFVGGILENKYMNAEEMARLAKIPSREELYAKMVGSLNAPISGFVNALAGNLRNLVYVLKAIEEKKS